MLAKYFGWELKNVRELSVAEHRIAVRIINDEARENKRAQQKAKSHR